MTIDLHPPAHKVIAQVCWTIAIMSVIFMLVSMPWVGPDKVIPGHTWLGVSLTGIIFFGGLGTGIYYLGGATEEIDQQVSVRFE